MERMRAGIVVGPGQVVCDEADFVEPGVEDVVVRSQLTSICGSDLHLIYNPWPNQVYPAPPGFPGHEGVGVVEHSNHADFVPGDKVLTVPSAFRGTCYNELQTLTGQRCVKLPETDVAPLHLLMAQQLGVVLFAAELQPVDLEGANVAIIGQGSAGIYFAWWAKRQGAATVIASDLSPARRAVGLQMGADIVVDGASPDNLLEAVRDVTGGQGAPMVIEAVGKASTLRQVTELAAYDGKILMFGLPEDDDDWPFHAYKFLRKRLQMWAGIGAQHEHGLVTFKKALRYIADGEIDMAPVVSHTIPLEDIGHALDLAHDRTDNAIKVSISF